MALDVSNLDNFTDRPVPEGALVSGLRVTMIVIGIAITIPAFLIGGEVVAGLGFPCAVLAIGCGAALVALVAGLTLFIAAKTRLTTYKLLQGPFGVRGGQFTSLVVSATLLGWFGVTAHLFGQAVASSVWQTFAVSIPDWPLGLAGSLLMTATAVYGFRAIEQLSRFVVPLLVILLVVALAKALNLVSVDALWQGRSLANSGIASVGIGISAVAGGFMVGATHAPDLGRFVKNTRHGLGAGICGYGIGYAIVLVLAGVPGLMPTEGSYLDKLVALGLGTPALLVIIFATWTTNTSNLYCASLGFARVFTGVKDWKLSTTLGILGTGVALLGLAENLVPLLVFLSITIPPISGVYIVHYLILERRSETGPGESNAAFRLTALSAWVAGSGLAWLASEGVIRMSGIIALDAFAAAALLYLVLEKLGSISASAERRMK